METIETNAELLRFTTAGSVDDGKSTLIGRLLYDSKSIFEDQLAAIETSTQRRGREGIDLSLLTDGLTAEREQGITIDVAYRYFSTPKRKFIIADTPGHEQYTRNMVTGAATADLAIILVDARKGMQPQSRRHAFISTLLNIAHVVVCVNKMDLVDWDPSRFEAIKDDFKNFTKDLGIHELSFIPVSALLGDNIVTPSANMSWYKGPVLLDTLETVEILESRDFRAMRFPVQWVNRPNHEYRGYCGQVAGGVIKTGQEVLVLPAGKTTKIRAIDTFDGSVAEAFPPMSVTLLLEDEVDISRGDVLVDPKNPPVVTQDLTADICWMQDEPLSVGKKYLIKHGCKTTKVIIKGLESRVDVNTLGKLVSTELKLNEIGRVTLKTQVPLAIDAYVKNRVLGSFILIDEASNATVGAGVIV